MLEIYSELKLDFSIRSSIIVSGNVKDVVPSPGCEGAQISLHMDGLVPFAKGIAALYHECGYAVLVYDNAASSYQIPYEDTVFQKYAKDASDIQDENGSKRDSAIISLLRRLMHESSSPVVVIVENAGIRKISDDLFVRMGDVLLNSGYVVTGRNIRRNQMLLLVDGPLQEEVIPKAFQKYSRIIPVGMPDKKERKTIITSAYDMFSYGDISDAERNRFQAEILQKTDGMDIRSLLMVPRTAIELYPENQKYTPANCLAAIQRVRYGRTYDPWSDPEIIHRIYSGELEKSLCKRVKGEEKLITLAVNLLKEATCEFMRLDPDYGKGPKLCLMIPGPTGVGKTEFARILCEIIYGSQDAMIQIDGGSLQDQQGASFLLGSAKGYIGSDEDGFLKSVLRDHPDGNVLLLFDELEKCHSSVYKALLSLLDTGEVTDLSGERLDFRNAILIFTSNVGIRKPGRSAAITETDTYICDPDTPPEEVEKAVANGMRETFSPEFLGRLSDRIVTLPFMTKDTAQEIVQERMSTWSQRAASVFDFDLKFSQAVVNKAKEYCTSDLSKGGRLVNRRLKSAVLAPIALKLTDMGVKAHEAIIVTGIDPDNRKANLRRS